MFKGSKKIFAKLKNKLSKTSSKLTKNIAILFGKEILDKDIYDLLEELLITADVGCKSTQYLLNSLKKQLSLTELKDQQVVFNALRNSMLNILKPLEGKVTIESKKPHVIMFVGVNGVGKTTTIGKLAYLFKKQGKSVILGAGDTFRAAAREQLYEWSIRNDIRLISSDATDPSSVCFDTVKSAVASQTDIAILDTAGRLSNKTHLMHELQKTVKAVNKVLTGAPHDVFLVLDGSSGQNCIEQVKHFNQIVNLTGIVITKLDGTSKGGIVFALSEYNIPIRFIGLGEGIEDLQKFIADDYVNAILPKNSKESETSRVS